VADRDLTPEEFADALGEMAPNLAKEGLSVNDEAAAKLLSNIVPNVKAIKSSVNKGIKIQGGTLNALLAPFKLIGSGFKTSLKTFGIDIAKFTSDVKGTFKKLGDKLNLKKQIGDAFSARFKQLQDAIKKPFTSIKNAFSKVGNFFGFKSKEQREEEEAKNPAKFIINYLKKNIEPLLKRLAGVGGGGGGDGGGGLFSMGGLPGLLTTLGGILAGFLAYFGFEGTAGAGFAQILSRTLTNAFSKGSKIIKTISTTFDDVGSKLSNIFAKNIPKTSAASKTAQTAASLAARTASSGASAIGGQTGRVTGGATQLVAGRVAIPAGVRQSAIDALPLSAFPGGKRPVVAGGGGTGTGAGAAASGKVGKTLFQKFLRQLLKAPVIATAIEGFLVTKDYSLIANSMNLTEEAKQELIGKRITQAITGVLGGLGGAAIGAALGAAFTGPVAPIAAPLLALAGAFGGDYFGRLLTSKIASSDNFGFIGKQFYDANLDLEAKNRKELQSLAGIQNPATGLDASIMLNKGMPSLDQVITESGNVSGLYNLINQGMINEIKASQEVQKRLESERQESNGGGTTVNDNSQANATEVNNFTAPGEVQPRNPDPVPDARFMGGYGQLATG
jgi:hypothetical protein